MIATPLPHPLDVPVSVDLVIDVPVTFTRRGVEITETPREAIEHGAGFLCDMCEDALTAMEIVLRRPVCGHCEDLAFFRLEQYAEDQPEEDS